MPDKPPPPPSRIRVGNRAGAAAKVPRLGGEWTERSRVSHFEIAAAAMAVEWEPSNECAREILAAFAWAHWRNDIGEVGLWDFLNYPLPGNDSRLRHVLWLIENRPDWSGFALPAGPLAQPRTPAERKSEYVSQVRDAWLRNLADSEMRPMVWHNAAMFFTASEPTLAAELMKRAIELEPGEPLFRERLGSIYGYSLFPARELGEFMGIDWQARSSFAITALAELMSTRDEDLMSGAFASLSGSRLGRFDLPDKQYAALLVHAKSFGPLRPPSWDRRFESQRCRLGTE